MRKLPSVLARKLASGTSGSPVLPDMSEGKVIGCTLEDLAMLLRSLFFQVVALHVLIWFG